MILIWYLTAYSPRDSLEPIEHATPPVVDGVVDTQALIAFILGSKAFECCAVQSPLTRNFMTLNRSRNSSIQRPTCASAVHHHQGALLRTLLTVLIAEADSPSRPQEKSTEGIEMYMFIALSELSKVFRTSRALLMSCTVGENLGTLVVSLSALLPLW